MDALHSELPLPQCTTPAAACNTLYIDTLLLSVTPVHKAK